MSHIIKEEDLLEQCVYCGNDLKEARWQSQFFGNAHYKTTKCSCGKESVVKLKYDGSGHDNFDKEKNIDQIVQQYRFDKGFQEN